MLKSIPIIIIIVLSFILIFSATSLTIKAATLSYPCLLLLLTSQICLLIYGLMHKQLYIGLVAFLILLVIVYTMYIKQLYIKEAQIIKELKEKDILE